MRDSLGTTFLVGGTVIAALGAVGLAAGVYVTIPRELLVVIAYKAPFIIGGVLMVTGAVLRRNALTRSAARPPQLPPPAPGSALEQPDAAKRSTPER